MDLKEINLDQRDLLLRLKRSPAWDLYRTHLSKRVSDKEAEKAGYLRRNDAHRAVLLQGQLDGLNEALTLLDKALTMLASEEEPPTTY